MPDDELRAVRGRDIAMIFRDPMSSLNPVLTTGRQITEILVRHPRHEQGGGEGRGGPAAAERRVGDSLRRRMQMVFQDPLASLDPRRSVESVLSEPQRTQRREEPVRPAGTRAARPRRAPGERGQPLPARVLR